VQRTRQQHTGGIITRRFAVACDARAHTHTYTHTCICKEHNGNKQRDFKKKIAKPVGAWTDQPKSAILTSPAEDRRRFSGLMSRWITFFLWQYCSAACVHGVCVILGVRITFVFVAVLQTRAHACVICVRTGVFVQADRVLLVAAMCVCACDYVCVCVCEAN